MQAKSMKRISFLIELKLYMIYDLSSLNISNICMNWSLVRVQTNLFWTESESESSSYCTKYSNPNLNMNILDSGIKYKDLDGNPF